MIFLIVTVINLETTGAADPPPALARDVFNWNNFQGFDTSVPQRLLELYSTEGLESPLDIPANSRFNNQDGADPETSIDKSPTRKAQLSVRRVVKGILAQYAIPATSWASAKIVDAVCDNTRAGYQGYNGAGVAPWLLGGQAGGKNNWQSLPDVERYIAEKGQDGVMLQAIGKQENPDDPNSPYTYLYNIYILPLHPSTWVVFLANSCRRNNDWTRIVDGFPQKIESTLDHMVVYQPDIPGMTLENADCGNHPCRFNLLCAQSADSPAYATAVCKPLLRTDFGTFENSDTC